MTKIANTCRYFYPFEGGIETFSLSLTKYLTKKGHDVHIFTTNFPENKLVDKKFGATIHRYNFFKFINEPVFNFYNDLKKFDPDVVHIQYPAPWCHFLSLIYCLRHKKKLVTTYHAKPISSIFAKIGGQIYDKLILFPFANKQKIVYTYSALGRKLKDSSVIPTGIDEKRFKKVNMKKEFDLIYVGRIVDYKRIEWLLEAAKELNLKVAVVGPGPYLDTLKQIAKDLKVNATFFGRVDNTKVHELYQKSKIYVLPSKSEGMPLTIPEALACGAVVMASRVGGIPDILEDRFLFDNYQQFIHKLRKIIAKLPKVSLKPRYFVDNVNKAYEKILAD